MGSHEKLILRLTDLYIFVLFYYDKILCRYVNFIGFFCLISEYIEKLLKEDLPKKLTGHPNQPKLPLGGLHVLFFLQLIPGSRDLSI